MARIKKMETSQKEHHRLEWLESKGRRECIVEILQSGQPKIFVEITDASPSK